ncbi:hypothetical protein ASF61_18875 [Duganella sp. Leaf126]|uniref:hypothetical protein n=1 Tax=Duganella sp. Leaf126 TaxID=1736266 RepID=UPI0006F1EE9C|nr:hypothetical protein [Duganella sp. Leaf126]KQQ45740.1 hypothetical protein ASF61_18875 [Duganella sp. Leaf126]
MSMPAPQTQRDIEALADSLSASADTIHARLMRAIGQHAPDGAGPAISQAAAQALFDDEVKLRQQAMGLYLQAATLAAGGLAGVQRQLQEITTQAQQKIARIDRIKDVIALTGELLSLAAAVATGAPDKLVAPYEKLKQRVESL